MLSAYSKQREQYGLPIVSVGEQNGFIDEENSINARQRRLQRLLLHSSQKARDYIELVVFTRNWMLGHLRLSEFSFTRQLAGADIDSSNDRSVCEEVNQLDRMSRAAINTRDSLVLPLYNDGISSAIYTICTSSVPQSKVLGRLHKGFFDSGDLSRRHSLMSLDFSVRLGENADLHHRSRS